MSFKVRPFFSLPVLLLMAGCAQTWVKPNAKQGEFESDRYSCLQQSQQRVADETKITKAQKAVLPKQRESIAERRKYFYELQIKYYGDLGRKRVDFSKSYLEPKEEANNLDLYNGKITWGQYNKARKEITADFTSKIKDVK